VIEALILFANNVRPIKIAPSDEDMIKEARLPDFVNPIRPPKINIVL
jgi:hypothetical protein